MICTTIAVRSVSKQGHLQPRAATQRPRHKADNCKMAQRVLQISKVNFSLDITRDQNKKKNHFFTLVSQALKGLNSIRNLRDGFLISAQSFVLVYPARQKFCSLLLTIARFPIAHGELRQQFSGSSVGPKCRFDYRPLFSKGTRAPPPNSLIGKGRHEGAVEIEPTRSVS